MTIDILILSNMGCGSTGRPGGPFTSRTPPARSTKPGCNLSVNLRTRPSRRQSRTRLAARVNVDGRFPTSTPFAHGVQQYCAAAWLVLFRSSIGGLANLIRFAEALQILVQNHHRHRQ